MSMWDHLKPDALSRAASVPSELPNGARVAKLGTVSFTRSGFARVRWDDGTTTEDWAAELVVVRQEEDR